MSQLHWWPHSPEEWDLKCIGLDFEQRGALLHVCGIAWRYRDPVGTIVNSATEFKNLLGPRWRRLLPVIQQHFTFDPSSPGVLRCAWLADLHAAQLTKYLSAAKRGGEGGRNKGMNTRRAKKKGQTDLFRPPKPAQERPLDPSPARAELVAGLTQIVEGSSVPSEQRRTPPLSLIAGGAPAPSAEWTGPDPAELRAWARSEQSIATAVVDRTRELSAHIPDNVQLPGMREYFAILAMQQVWDARHRPEVAS